MASREARPDLPRPRRVARAAHLALGAFAVALINTVRLAPGIAAMPLGVAILSYALVSSILWLLLILAFYRGRNWARILFAVMSLLSIPGVALVAAQPYPRSIVAVHGAQSLLNTAAAVLLLTPQSSLWFRAAKHRRGSRGASSA